ncbi:MAG: TonB-dependent receptor [Oligoflexia bacterium]|nr:TonB-dependent receptor [Oligoflexia bacterium]
MKKIFNWILLSSLLSSITLVTTITVALSANEDASFSSLNLKDILDIKVSVASKREEKVIDAPGIITVISKKQIEGFGARHVGDVFDRVIGMRMSSGAGGSLWNLPNPRQQELNLESFHTLILINGRPVRERGFGGHAQNIVEGFPLDAIKQIEIIRGPGSVLYGSNAFSGVINIITEDKKDNIGGKVKGTAGSYGALEENGSIWFNQGGLNGHLAVKNFTESNGQEFSFYDPGMPPFLPPSKNTIKLHNNNLDFFGNINFKDIHINTFASKLNPGEGELGSGDLFSLRDKNTEVEYYFADIGYKYHVSDKLEIAPNITYNRLLRQSANFVSNNNYLYELNLLGKISGINYVIGGLAENSRVTGAAFGDDITMNTYGTYIQLDHNPIEQLKLIVGAQWNKPESINGNWSPRAGIVFHPQEEWTLKALYSSAFRSSSLVEAKTNMPGQFIGNPTLKPETINTLDLQVAYNLKTLDLSATYFNSRMKDIIEIYVGGQTATERNHGKYDYWGTELEGKWTVADYWLLDGSYTLVHSKDIDNQKDTFYGPTNILKGGVLYSNKPFEVGLFNSYFNGTKKIPNAAEINKEVKAYNLLSLQASYDFSKLIGYKKESKLSLYFYNLLNEDPYIPSRISQNINSIPLMNGGRSVYATISTVF